jgi:hypothetical protein
MNKLLFLLVFIFTPSLYAAPKRVLFLGNSYTYFNDLPNMFKSISESLQDSVTVDSYAPGGYTLNAMSNDVNAMNKIKLGNWDFIVIQAQSQEPSFSPAQVATGTYPFAKKLCDSIKAYNNCGEILFFMTWGRKNGDASNCGSYPPVCTYAGMQQRLRESYLEMCDSNDATCVPVGVAWKNVRDTNPSIELYNPDESHPSLQGTFLAASVFYTSIFKKYTTLSSYLPAGITNSDGFTLQTIAGSTVIDSIENWQQYGHLPKSSFTKTNSGNTYTFTNTTLRGNTYLWNFGDGNTSILQNPVHTYTASGNYFVKLKSTSTSCKTDSSTHSIFLTVGVTDVEKRDEKIVCINKQLHLSNFKGNYTLLIRTMEGNTVLEKTLLQHNNKIDISHIANGIYTFTIQYQQGNDTFGSKFLIQ